jgi:hypothetical protein
LPIRNETTGIKIRVVDLLLLLIRDLQLQLRLIEATAKNLVEETIEAHLR